MVGERALNAIRSEERSAAFERLAEHHIESSYRMAALVLRDPNEAEDATHGAFVLAWRNWSSLRDSNRFEARFGRILTNVCRDRLRRGRRIHLARRPHARCPG
jgi:DNA-directed RNA polymerase specialized sigma24 family protein